MTEKSAAKIDRDIASTPEQLIALVAQGKIIDRLLAKHPNAAADLLAKLSHSGDKTTRKNVALNPNSGKEILLALAPQFPVYFFRNPAFDWLLLEDPDLLFNLEKGVLKNILKRPECPESFMKWAAEHGSEQEMLAVAMNPAAPLDALQRLGSHDGPAGLAARSHEKLASNGPSVDAADVLENEVKSALGEIDADDARSYWKRGLIGASKWQWLGVKARLEVLYLSDWVYRDDWVAQHADQLASDADPLVREIVASSHLATPSVLKELSKDADPLVRLSASRQPSAEQLAAESAETEPSELQRLAASKSVAVLRAVAGNRASSVAVLENLAGHKNAEIRQSVAGNQATDIHVLERLAAAKEHTVRAAAASNPVTPVAVTQLLLKDKSPEVRQAAVMALATGMRDAASWTTSAEILATLAISRKSELRLAVARNSMASEPVRNLAFASLIAEAGPIKQKELADDASCPPLLRQQARARIWWRQLNLSAKKPFQAPSAAVLPVDPDISELVELLRQEANFLVLDPARSLLARALGIVCGDVMTIPGEAAETACNARARAIRLMGLRHPKTGPEALAKRSKSTDWAERLAIASNHACPPNILSTLKLDAHQLVAQQAQATELLKADDAARKLAIVASSGDDLDLGMIVSELSTRLRKGCRSWLLSDTPWWNCLTFEQRGRLSFELTVGQDLQAFPCALSIVARHPDVFVRQSIASTPSTPAATLAVLANDPEDLVREAVASNSATPIDVLGFLAKDGTWRVRAAIARNANASAGILAILSQDQEPGVRRVASTHVALTTSLLDALGMDGDDDVRCAVAENIRTSAQTLEVMAVDKAEQVRAAVAVNRAVTAVAMHVLARDKCVAVRKSLARNVCLAQAMIEILATDKNEDVRQKIACNSATPRSILTALARDKNSFVRRGVASNIRTLPDDLFVLADDKDEWVRRGVAQNQYAPILVLIKLANDREYQVGNEVKKNTSNAISVVAAAAEPGSAGVELRRYLARSLFTPVEVLESLASDQDEKTRVNVACNHSAPSALLSKLAKDASASVRRAVVIDPSISRHSLIFNPAIPLQSLNELLGELLSDEASFNFIALGFMAAQSSTPVDILTAFSLNKHKDVRRGVARNPNAPMSFLELLGKDKEDEVRSAIAANKATPLAVLGWLAIDASSAVRKAVPLPEVLSRRQAAALCAEAQSSIVSDERLLEMGRSGYWIARLTAIGNPSYPATRHDADLADTLASIASAMTSPVQLADHTVFQLADLLAPLAALDLLPIPSDAKHIAKAAKSKDWVERAGVTMCQGVQPSLLRMLLDDEVEVVKQLAIRRLKEMEAA